MSELWSNLLELAVSLGRVGVELVQLGWHYVLIISWVAYWLWAADWRKIGPALAAGAWAPVVLLALFIALIWSSIAPRSYELWGLTTVSNYWWQLLYVGALFGIAGVCGYLQCRYAWFPEEVVFDTPASHDHGHGHEAGHAPGDDQSADHPHGSETGNGGH